VLKFFLINLLITGAATGARQRSLLASCIPINAENVYLLPEPGGILKRD